LLKKWSASPSILLTPMGIVSALVLISIIVSQFGAVHAQDYVTAYAQNEAAFTVAFEGPVSSFYRVGSYRLLWRLRVTPSSASLGQTIEVNVDIKVSISWSRSSLPDQGTWPKVYPGATNTMLVKIEGLTEPQTRSFNPAMIVGLESGQTLPEQFEGTGSLTFEFLVPLDAGPGDYVIQAESESWNPCNAVTLHVVRQDQTAQTQATQTTGAVIPNPFGTVDVVTTVGEVGAVAIGAVALGWFFAPWAWDVGVWLLRGRSAIKWAGRLNRFGEWVNQPRQIRGMGQGGTVNREGDYAYVTGNRDGVTFVSSQDVAREVNYIKNEIDSSTLSPGEKEALKMNLEQNKYDELAKKKILDAVRGSHIGY